jgi:E3 ubiquitin-protein ligase HERC2
MLLILGNLYLTFFQHNETFRRSREADLDLVLCANMYSQEFGKDPCALLLNEFGPSESFLSQFKSLVPYSLAEIKSRFVVLQHFNMVLGRVLSLVDLSRGDSDSHISALIRLNRGLIFSSVKDRLLSQALDMTSVSNGGCGEVRIDRFKSARLKEKNGVDSKAKRTAFGQIYQQVHSNASSVFRLRKSERAWKVTFVGEFSDDYGGPYRASLDEIAEELQSSVLPLFIPCPNRRAKLGLNQEKFVPAPSARQPLHISLFEFVGKLMGIAVRTGNLLNFNFPKIVWKSLANEPINKQDVLDMDSLAFKMLESISKIAEDPTVEPDMVEDILCMNFMLTGSDGVEVELLPGGADVAVGFHNREQYEQLVVNYRIQEFSAHCEAIRKGFSTVVPYPLFSLFTGAELEVHVCGLPQIDIALLRKMSVYDGCTGDDRHIRFFWETLQSFSDIERSQFLKFVWGRSRLPLKESDFECKFKVTSMIKSRGNPDKFLPVSHTCFFSLELPQYSTQEIMTSRIRYAITHCVSIDADATSAARNAAAMTTQDDDDDDE